MMDGETEIELLQRYRRDRREMLSFLLSASLVKKVVMPPGAVSLDDIDLDKVSVDHVLECVKKGTVLDLSEAIKAYYDDVSLPPKCGSGAENTFFLVTIPDTSGLPPIRMPPPIPKPIPAASPSISKTYSHRSAPSQQLSVDDEIEDFEDDDEDDVSMEYTSRRQLNDISDLVLKLPPFKTGIIGDDLRETAYELLLAVAGASGGLVIPTIEKKKEKKSRLMRKLTRSKGESPHSQPQKSAGLASLLEIMRAQLEISEAADLRTKKALLNASATRVGKKMDSLLVPMELLLTIGSSDFNDKKSYLRWQKRQLNILEEGLLNHPAVCIDAYGRLAAELRVLLMKIEEAEGLPLPAGPSQRSESLKAMKEVALTLAERPARNDITGEVCHWADGYYLNVCLYEKLLCSVFDVLDEGKLVEEVDEILNLLKSTWKVLGITQTIHDTCYSWVLFRQYVLTGDSELLQHATQQMKRIALDGQRSAQERLYIKGLYSVVENCNVSEKLSYVQSVLVPIKIWTDNKLGDYHAHFSEGSSIMDGILTIAMVVGRLIADESDETGVMRMTSTAEKTAVNKEIEAFVLSSVKLAYNRVLSSVESKAESEDEHYLTILAEAVKGIARKEQALFTPILSRWNPLSLSIAVTLLHELYGKELNPFLDKVTHLTEDAATVIPAADNLEHYLLELNSSVNQDAVNDGYERQITLYQVDAVSSTLLMRWINTQLGRLSEWIERTIQQEKWEPSSTQTRHGNSIIEVYRIIDETVDQFFRLKLPMRIPQLNALLSGLDNALQIYAQRVVSQIGDKSELIPPVPILTRHKRESSIKAFTKKKPVDSRVPDDRASNAINALTTSKLCVRLNSLHYCLNHLSILEDGIRENWSKKWPQDIVAPGRSMVANNGKPKRVNAGDTISSAFENTRKVANAAIDRICEFIGTKIIFWDMREPFITGLYRENVSQARMETVVQILDSVLVELCDVIVEPLRDRVAIGLLQASLDGMMRVLLDGGHLRVFCQADAIFLEEDLQLLKEFFMAGGDGIPRGVVENAADPVQKIIRLYGLETYELIEKLRHASDEMTTGATIHRSGNKTASDTDILLRVLCHRSDSEASSFLKRQYKMPSSAA